MSDWKSSLKKKLEERTSSEFDQNVLMEIQKRSHQNKNSIQRNWIEMLVPALSLGFVVLVFVISPTKFQKFTHHHQNISSLNKEETVYENLQAITALDEAVAFSEDDWDELLEFAP